jgi:proline racemase
MVRIGLCQTQSRFQYYLDPEDPFPAGFRLTGV